LPVTDVVYCVFQELSELQSRVLLTPRISIPPPYTHEHARSSVSDPIIAPSNTAKLSSPILLPRTVSYDASSNPPRPSGPYRTMSEQKTGRRRRSSSLLYQEPPETIEHMSDQAALPNLNADWVNAKGQHLQKRKSRNCPAKSSAVATFEASRLLLGIKVSSSLALLTYHMLTGAWTIHVVLIACLKILFDIIPGVSQETSWTLTNISYMFGSFLMFHWVRGVPFEFNAGAYDNLNMWEQIDNGAQYTPAKKFLLSVPIVLFLLSTHYTHYDLTYFTINFLAVLGVVIPKLPYVGFQLASWFRE